MPQADPPCVCTRCQQPVHELRALGLCADCNVHQEANDWNIFLERIDDWRRGFRVGPPTLADLQGRTTLDELMLLSAIFVIEERASLARILKARKRTRSEWLLDHYLDDLWEFVREKAWNALPMPSEVLLEAWDVMKKLVTDWIRREAGPNGGDDGTAEGLDRRIREDYAKLKAAQAKRSEAAKRRADRNRPRDARMIKEATQMRDEGCDKSEIYDRLAERHKLTRERIAQILRQAASAK